MRITVLVFILFFTYNNSISQSLSDLSFGSDETFEVITWNIEWFPKNGQTTVDSVAVILQALDVDVFALQEIDDTVMFKQMVNNLNGYDYFFKSSWFAGLAYVYKTESIVINDIYEIYITEPYWSPFPRSPVVMELTFNDEEIIIINNHFKCCGDGIMNVNDSGDEETRRFIASNLLKEYIDTNFQDKRVIMLGDLNDILTDNESNNVFLSFINDSLNYKFADMEIANGSSSDWSYPTWPSHLDHILLTNEIFNEFEDDNSTIQVIMIDDYITGGWNTYDNNISDHRPVALKLKLTPNSISQEFNSISHPTISIFPNPCINQTTISFVPLPEKSTLNTYDINGKLISQNNIPANTQSISLNTNNYSSGLCFVQRHQNYEVLNTVKLIIVK